MEGRTTYPYQSIYPNTIPDSPDNDNNAINSLQRPELRINTVENDEVSEKQTRVFENVIQRTSELLLRSGIMRDQETQHEITTELKKYIRDQTDISTVKYAISKGKDENKNDIPPDCLPTLSLLDEIHLQEIKLFLEERISKTGFFSPYNLFIQNGVTNSLFIALAAFSPYALIPAVITQVGSQYFHQRHIKHRANEVMNDLLRLELKRKGETLLNNISAETTSPAALKKLGLFGQRISSAPSKEENDLALPADFQP